MKKKENADQLVWVYRYKYWDESSQTLRVSDRFAILEMIRNGLGVPDFAQGKKVLIADVVGGHFQDSPRDKTPH